MKIKEQKPVFHWKCRAKVVSATFTIYVSIYNDSSKRAQTTPMRLLIWQFDRRISIRNGTLMVFKELQ